MTATSILEIIESHGRDVRLSAGWVLGLIDDDTDLGLLFSKKTSLQSSLLEEILQYIYI